MNAPPVSQLDLASLPLASGGITALLDHPSGAARQHNFKPFALRTPTPAATTRSPIAPAGATVGPWRLPGAVGPVLARSLRERWELYQARLKDCQKDFSAKTVHELRVATRRLMAQFVMLGCVTPGQVAEEARRLLKRRLKALGELRDAHVQRSFIERRMVRYPELLLVRDSLQRRERRLERVAAAEVKGFRTRKLGKWTLALEQHLARKSEQARGSDRLATAVARSTTKAFADVVRRRAAIDPANPATFHRTRIAFKKFRYMVESLSPDLTGMSKRELRALAHYQRRMGILQDLEVMQRCIMGFVNKRKGMESLLRPFVRYLQASRARALRSTLRSADQLFRFWPPGPAKAERDIAAARDAA
jgi:CHAD domain-containing protein